MPRRDAHKKKQRILMCVPKESASAIKTFVDASHVDDSFEIIGNAPAYNVLYKAFVDKGADVLLIHADMYPYVDEIALPPMSFEEALAGCRAYDKSCRIVAYQGMSSFNEQTQFLMKSASIEIADEPDPSPEGFARLFGIAEAFFLQPVVSFISLKGGAGKTTTSCNFAAHAAGLVPPKKLYSGYLADDATPMRVLLWDLDMQSGDIGVLFDVPPEKNIYDLFKQEKTIDALTVSKYIWRTPHGFDVLAAPIRFDKVLNLEERQFTELLDILVQIYHVVVIDLPTEIIERPLTYNALKHCTHIVNVVTPDKVGIKSGAMTRKVFDYLPKGDRRFHAVLNMLKDEKLDIEHIESLIGSKIEAVLPYTKKLDDIEGWNPIVIGSDKKYREEIKKLAKAVLPSFEEKKRRGGLFR